MEKAVLVVCIVSESKAIPLLQWVNVAAFLVTLLVNGLANTTILNGRTTGEVSDLYPTLVTPAGYVFGIWGVIYVLLLVFAVFQLLPTQREKTFHRQIGILFVLSCVFNVVWLFLWQYGYIVLSVPLMFALLTTLVVVYLRLNIGKSDVTLKERLSVHLPFSVYLGWITIASIADVAAALVSVGWDGFGLSDTTWALVVIVVALVIALLVVFTRRDVAYGLVVVWALVGVTAKQSGNQSIVTTAEISAALVAVALVVSVLISRLRR